MNRYFLCTKQLSIFLLIIASSFLWSQNSPDTPLFLQINPPIDNPIPQAEEILQSAYSRQLRSAGYHLADSPAENVLIVAVNYRTLGGRTMYYDVIVTESDNDEPLISRSYEVEIDARLNRNLQSHIAQIIEELQTRTAENAMSETLPEISAESSRPEDPSETESPETGEQNANDPGNADAADEDQVLESPPPSPDNDDITQEIDAAPQRTNPFSGSVSGGLFIPMGEIVSYASPGYALSGFFGYKLPNENIGIAAGLFTGLISFRATGLADETDVTLVPFGGGLRITSSGQPTFTPVWYLQGGGTVMLYSTENAGSQQKVIPYISSGIGLNAQLFRAAGLQFRIDFSIFLESSLTILGISPIIGVSF